MKKIVFIIALLGAPFAITAGTKKQEKNLPKDHLLTIENETGHRLFIMEDRSFKKLDPQEAVVLYWKKPLNTIKERTIYIYYGGNIRHDQAEYVAPVRDETCRRHFGRREKKPVKKEMRMPAQSSGKPAMIAQLRTNQPGTICLSYDQRGILKMERI